LIACFGRGILYKNKKKDFNFIGEPTVHYAALPYDPLPFNMALQVGNIISVFLIGGFGWHFYLFLS
jgi:hypothetical protein